MAVPEKKNMSRANMVIKIEICDKVRQNHSQQRNCDI